MNRWVGIGNLTRDPEIRTTQSGVTVCNFTLAVQRRFTNQQGVREADFIPIVAFKQQAEACGRYLTKGRKAAVSGSIQTRSYDAQDGTKRYVTEIIADEITFLPSSQNNQQQDSGDSSQQGYQPQPTTYKPQPSNHQQQPKPQQTRMETPPPQMPDDYDDELPF